MAAPAILTQDTTITIDDSGGNPVTINGHQSITGIGSGTASIIDVTTLLSTAKEKRMGLQDWGTFTMNFIWNPDDAGQAAMADAMNNQSERTFILTLPNTDPVVTLNVWTAQVFVLQMQTNLESDSVAKGTAQFAVTGLPVWS